MSNFYPIDGLKLQKRIQSIGLRGKMIPNADMKKITWFRVGGPAEILYYPNDCNDLIDLLQKLPDVPITVIGLGSNLLVRDGGIPGIVIRFPNKNFGNIEVVSDNMIYAGASASDKRISYIALKNNIMGFHFYSGIPGSLGGALKTNAGANGLDTSQRVIEVHTINRKGKKIILSNNDMKFTYRRSNISKQLICIAALLKGEKGCYEEISQEIQNVHYHRKLTQPIGAKTSGSTFCNPTGISAWKAINGAGCCGLKIGGAQISPIHSNFMVNIGNATGYDLECLGETVRTRVFHKYGIFLCWEINRVGQFLPHQKSISNSLNLN